VFRWQVFPGNAKPQCKHLQPDHLGGAQTIDVRYTALRQADDLLAAFRWFVLRRAEQLNDQCCQDHYRRCTCNPDQFLYDGIM